jgi:hypothetical protein
MSSVGERPDISVDDVVTLASELPGRVRSLRVATHGSTDIGRSRLAWDRSRSLLARHLPTSPDAVSLIERQSVTSWMVLSESSWNRPMFDVLPARWREEHETTNPDGSLRHFVQGHDEDTYWWDQGEGVKATDGATTQTSLVNVWVVGTRWTTAPAELSVMGAATVLGRSGVRVRIVPTPGVRWPAGAFGAGDAHEFVVDVETGLMLSVTSFVDGEPFHRREVDDFEINCDIDPAITAAPADAEVVPVSRKFLSPADVANAAGFALLAPTWLPDEYTFQTGSARDGDDGVSASLIFSHDRHEFVTLYQQPEPEAIADDVYEWQTVERGSRVVRITDLGDEPGERIAHTTLGGTLAVVYASLSAPDLLELTFSLEAIES